VMAGDRRVARALGLKPRRQLCAKRLASAVVAVGHRGGTPTTIGRHTANNVDRLVTRSQKQAEITLHITAAIWPGGGPERHVVGHQAARLGKLTAQQTTERRRSQIGRVGAIPTQDGLQAWAGMAGVRAAEGA